MAHWIFSTQYLHTSLILPSLFTEAKLEWLQDEASPEKNFGQWNTHKIEEYLTANEENSSGNLLDTFGKCDDVIKS